MVERTEYALTLTINERLLSRVIIDQHYKTKHPDVTDPLILELVKQLDGGNFNIEFEANGFEYFRVAPLYHDNDPYRVIVVLCVSEDYLGVVNAFRVRRQK